MRFVIIGNSAAGLAGAETIRRLEPQAPITIISDEPYPPYCRPLLTYLLGGNIQEKDLWLKATDYYQRWQFTPILGKRAVQVDPNAKTVLLDSGEAIPYDRLLSGQRRPAHPAGHSGAGFAGSFHGPNPGTFQSHAADAPAGDADGRHRLRPGGDQDGPGPGPPWL